MRHHLLAIATAAGLLLAGGGLAAARTAGAATETQSAAPAASFQLAQRGDRHHRRDWRRDRHRDHFRGHRHWRGGPPHGWRRYHSRPWDWRTRGCVMFGPVWFCP